MSQNALLFGIGIARKAGKLTSGTEMVLDVVRKHGAHTLVIAARDLSDNSVKKLKDCCSYYHAELVIYDVSKEELGAAIGKSFAACVCVYDANLRELWKHSLSKTEWKE